LIGDGIGHIAVSGVALGLVVGHAPILIALVTAIVGAITIELIRARGEAFGEIALAMLFYGGIAGGVVLVSRAPSGTRNLNQYLFGSITTTSASDLVTFSILAAVILALTTWLGPALFAVSNDDEFARASGLPVMPLNIVLAVLTACTVVISMRVVGVLLVSALMVVPVATAQLWTSSFRTTRWLAMAVGFTVALVGVVLSYYVDTPSGGTIVLLAIAVFGVTVIAQSASRLTRR